MDSFFPSNLKYLRLKNNIEQIQLASYLGKKSSSSISDWENGKYTPKAKTLSEIAKFFRIELSDLMENDLSIEVKSMNKVSEIFYIPIIGTIACGDPITATENIIGYREEVKELLPAGELFYLKCKGKSMEPTIPSGSFVLIRQQEAVENGEIAAVLINGNEDATLKRVKIQDDNIILLPDNRDYEPIIVNRHNPAKILGKAIKVSFDL